MVRYGTTQLQRQTHSSAPARRGVYAMPAAASDSIRYLSSHRWDALVPKRLRIDNITAVDDDGERADLHQDREAWLQANSRQFGLTRFDYGGIVYCRMMPNGEVVGHPDFDPDGWNALTVAEFVKAAKRCLPGINSTYGGECGFSTDHLEVFIPEKID